MLLITTAGAANFSGQVLSNSDFKAQGSYPSLALDSTSYSKFSLVNRYSTNRMSFDTTPQGGTNIEAAYLYNNGRFDFNYGISFPNPSPASSGTVSSSTLDAYEEGSWTPTISHNDGSGAISLTISSGSAKYVRVGNIVHIKAFLTDVNPNGNQGGSGAYYAIRSLPFNCVGFQSWEVVYATSSMGSYGGYAHGDNLYFMHNAGGQNSSVHVNGSQFNAWGSSIGFVFSCTYTLV
jgi:hypothetical protein